MKLLIAIAAALVVFILGYALTPWLATLRVGGEGIPVIRPLGIVIGGLAGYAAFRVASDLYLYYRARRRRHGP
jgi:hypothetical protein